MPWIRPTLPELVTRIKADVEARLTGGVALLRRALLYILVRVFAGAVHILHGYLEFLSRQILADLAEGAFLDRHAVQWGITRKAATFAQGTIKITGDNGSNIFAGTVLLSDAGVEYVTDSDVVIVLGEVLANVTCSVPGTIGNLDPALFLTFQSALAGVDDTAEVQSPGIGGGAEQETDEDLRVRILQRIQNPAAGGSEADYVGWALSVSGVAKAWAFGSYFGLGTVAVVIADADANPEPSAGLISDVAAYIDPRRPVTAQVTVAGVDAKTIDLTISISPNTAAVQAQITAALQDLFAADAFPGGILYFSHLNEAVAGAGVLDHAITVIKVDTVSVPLSNYQFVDFEYAVLGTITFNTL